MRYFLQTVLYLILLFPSSQALASHEVFDANNRQTITFEEMVQDVIGSDLIFVGEEHDNIQHHQNQLRLIDAMHRREIPFAIGLEMFQADQQEYLDKWINSKLSEETFKEIYLKNWNFPWALYKDIFLYAREHKIPLVGLNVDREIVKQVGREGFNSLSPEQLQKLPGVSCSVDKTYEEVIRRALGSHDSEEFNFKNFCEAQMVWDSTMATRLIDYLAGKKAPKVVVLAGGSHAWKYGIPSQVAQRTQLKASIIIPERNFVNRDNVSPKDTDYLWLAWLRKSTVYFDQGHGQVFLAEATGDFDLSNLAGIFLSRGFEVRVGKETLSTDALANIDVLVISGPFKPFTPTEIDAIDRFIQNGGNVSVMLHIAPLVAPLIDRFGVLHSNGVIHERENLLSESAFDFSVRDMTPHMLTKGIDSFNVYGVWALMNNGENTSLLARTSSSAWVDLNKDKVLSEHDAVQALGVIAAGKKGKGKFVVFGDDAVFQNRFLKNGNKTLANNLVNWLMIK